MTKKRARKNTTRKAAAKTSKRTRTRATARTRKARTSRAVVRVSATASLAAAPATMRKAIAREIQEVLARHGVDGTLEELRVAPRRVVVPCPPRTVRRVVCGWQGTKWVCEERCEPR